MAGCCFELGMFGEKDDARAVAFLGDAPAVQLVDQGIEPWIVEALAEGVIEADAEPVVDGVELMPGIIDHLLPDRAVLGIALLQFEQFLAGKIEERGVLFALGVDQPVEPFHLGERIPLERRPVEMLFPANQQLAELGAPIADVIVRDHPVTEQSKDPRQRIAQDRGSDMADMHGLGHVRRTEIDHDRARLFRRHKEPMIAPRGRLQHVGNGVGFKPEVEKTGARHRRRFARLRHVEVAQKIRRQLPRVEFAGFGQRHHGVDLVIAETGIGAGLNLDCAGIGIWQHPGQGLSHAVFNETMEHGRIRKKSAAQARWPATIYGRRRC